MLRVDGLDLLNRIIVTRRNIMNRVARQPRESGHWLDVGFTARTLGSVNHLSTVRRNIKIVEVGPNRTRREESFGRDDRSEPNIQKRGIGREKVAHVSLRKVMTGIAEKNGRSRNGRE
jgi:hypothetical protein